MCVCIHTFIVLDLGRNWLGVLAVSDLVHREDTELVLLVLRQVVDGSTALWEHVSCHVKLSAVRPHLLHKVPRDGASSIGMRELPGQADAGLPPVGVVQLLWSRGGSWRSKVKMVRLDVYRPDSAMLTFFYFITHCKLLHVFKDR